MGSMRLIARLEAMATERRQEAVEVGETGETASAGEHLVTTHPNVFGSHDVFDNGVLIASGHSNVDGGTTWFQTGFGHFH